MALIDPPERGAGGGGLDLDDTPRVDYDDGDRGLLLEFVRQLGETLGNVAQQADVLFDEDLATLLRSAWDRVNPRFRDVLDGVAEIDEAILGDHGLLGPELALKLHVWNASRQEFNESFEAMSAVRRAPGLWRRALGATKRALGFALSHADTVVDSVASALSVVGPAAAPAAAAAGAIGEFKTVVEKVAARGEADEG